MTRINRRAFLQGAASLAALPLAVQKALALAPRTRTGTIADLEHVVILMQENRSFDHYFGCLRGVRGFGDPRPLILPSGQTVFHQPVGAGVTESILPFRFNSESTSAACIASLDHEWKGQFSLWKHHDVWIPVKTPLTMGYFTREDLPFYYALADAFTVCDAYHCSLFGPTDPNRMYLFTGTSGATVGNLGSQVVHNEDDLNYTGDASRDDPNYRGYEWKTYAERLQQAGISWKVYQEYDNYGDNSLAYFTAFRGLSSSAELYQRGRAVVAGSNAKNAAQSIGQHLVRSFAEDVANETLPQVSWLVAPHRVCEHPDAPPVIGENFSANVVAALASNPNVWAKSAFILMYDENDGFFDHVPPAVVPIRAELGASTVSTAGESWPDEPLGLGPRVPLLVVSPWTRGGWVNSQLFDHTSVIRLLEARFGVHEPNISAWRRAVIGDLTSVFDFGAASYEPAPLPQVQARLKRLDSTCKLAAPRPPATQSFPVVEPGARPSRPLPYSLAVSCTVGTEITLNFLNEGRAGACFQVVYGGPVPPGPWFYTVEAGKSLTGTAPGPRSDDEIYDLTVFGPNGFFRRFRGAGRSLLEAEMRYDAKADELVVTLINNWPKPVAVDVLTNLYGLPNRRRYNVPSGGRVEDRRSIAASGYWYDISITQSQQAPYLRRLAGHIETGAPSISDPAIGRA
jgi:phospholipase C